ncbi:MAG: lipid-binding SYLF domain-containing protein [Telluria sp.]
MHFLLRFLNAFTFAVVALMLAPQAFAQSQSESGAQPSSNKSSSANAAAARHVDDATNVLKQMMAEPGASQLLAQAKGIYIVPRYGRAALGLGASGGAGVFLARRPDGTWGEPAFFNIGGISIGLQAGAEGGPVVLVLANDKAVAGFREKNNFNLSADAGLTVVNWNKQVQGQVGKADVLVWSGSKGLFGNVATLAINDIHFNQRATNAYYGKAVSVQDVMAGKVTNPQADQLRQALASAAGAK